MEGRKRLFFFFFSLYLVCIAGSKTNFHFFSPCERSLNGQGVEMRPHGIQESLYTGQLSLESTAFHGLVM